MFPYILIQKNALVLKIQSLCSSRVTSIPRPTAKNNYKGSYALLYQSLGWIKATGKNILFLTGEFRAQVSIIFILWLGYKYVL